MGMVDMSNNNNKNPSNSRTKDFFASPALSLSLAGIFRGARGRGATEQAASAEVEEGDEGSGGGRRDDQTVEISSENSGPVRSRSLDEDFENEVGDHDIDDSDEDEDGDKNRKKKKRKKYHRHTTEQIREMEA